MHSIKGVYLSWVRRSEEEKAHGDGLCSYRRFGTGTGVGSEVTGSFLASILCIISSYTLSHHAFLHLFAPIAAHARTSVRAWEIIRCTSLKMGLSFGVII